MKKGFAEEKSKDGRISKPRYYMNIAKEVSQRSTCLSVQLGAVLVKDDQIIATGYVGAPRKTLSSLDRNNCLRRELNIPSGQQYELCRSVHAEQNAIINAARAGVSTLNSEMYLFGKRIWQGADNLIDSVPCFICKKMIINAGITKIYMSNKKAQIEVLNIEELTNDWQKNDLISDNIKYTTDYSKNGE